MYRCGTGVQCDEKFARTSMVQKTGGFRFWIGLGDYLNFNVVLKEVLVVNCDTLIITFPGQRGR